MADGSGQITAAREVQGLDI
uniref:Uncharacterized protein n=1 Tax=Anguilla anguilla TaxID=7936 RepID=A0A0E9TRB3_ANGAN